LIIGSDPTPEVEALANVPGIKVLGYVPETKPYLEMAAVSVAPLRVGGGMKGKVNEAMAHGIPVVATHIGAQGFDAIHGKNMMITDDAAEFASCVNTLLDDDVLQQNMGLAGQELNSAICSHRAVKEKIRGLVDHCSGLIPRKADNSFRNSLASFYVKFFLFIKDIGYAYQLLQREGIKSFFRRTWLYMQGQRFPDDSRLAADQPSKSLTAIHQPLVIINPDMPQSVLEFSKPPEAPMVSIIIPVYNQWEFTFACLGSILKNSDGIAYEILLADDNSTDDTQYVKQFVKNIHVLRNEKNIGFLFNCNNAVTLAKGKYIVLLNNDTLVQPDWLRWLVKTMEEHPDVGMAGAKLVFSTGELQEAGGIIFKDGSAANYGRFDWPGLPQYNYLKDVDYCSGACICVRKELWVKAGGFDPIFSPGYYEDTDLAMQIRRMGYRTVFQPKSVLIHFDGISHGTDLTDGIKSRQPQNQRLFLEKWKKELDRNHYSRRENTFRARDKSKHKHIVLLVDYSVPTSSSHIDTQTYYRIVANLLKKGLKVIILPENFLKTEPEVDDFEQKGIEVLYGRWYKENWGLWITENALNINTVVFIDNELADKWSSEMKSKTETELNILVYKQGLEFDLNNIEFKPL
ncbi:MAG: glycosyltransferase, partial [Bacteroidota bacterium]